MAKSKKKKRKQAKRQLRKRTDIDLIFELERRGYSLTALDPANPRRVLARH